MSFTSFNGTSIGRKLTELEESKKLSQKSFSRSMKKQGNFSRSKNKKISQEISRNQREKGKFSQENFLFGENRNI